MSFRKIHVLHAAIVVSLPAKANFGSHWIGSLLILYPERSIPSSIILKPHSNATSIPSRHCCRHCDGPLRPNLLHVCALDVSRRRDRARCHERVHVLQQTQQATARLTQRAEDLKTQQIEYRVKQDLLGLIQNQETAKLGELLGKAEALAGGPGL